MDVKEKMKMLKEDQSSIHKMLEKNLAIDQTLISKQILLIKTDLISQDEAMKKTALDMLEFLLNQKSSLVQSEIIKILNVEGGNEVLDSLIVQSLRKKVVDNIMKAQNFTDILLPWQNENIMKLTVILEDVLSNEIPKEKCKYFFINKVIPVMMLLNTDNTLRNIYIEIAFLLSRIIATSELSTEELERFLKEINTKYIGAISQLRDGGFLNWHKLWIFLVRFCDRNIHNSMDLTNRLLRVVEFAFRNSSVEQRLKGYDCWKELIDNASLDKNHISSSKQIKLLITPLRAKFSKQEVVICKRFDIFVYLLEKLQHKAVLCLPEFLEFCFGSIVSNKDCSRSGQGRAIPELWIRSTKVLMEIIGHSHGNSINCLNTKDVINLEEPIINQRNMQAYYKIIINSVSQSCILLKDVEMESKKMEAIKCMWVAVFDLIVPASQSNKGKYINVLSDALNEFINQSTSNTYFQELVVLVITVLMSFDKDLICECIKSILSQLLTVLFTFHNIPSNISDNFKQALMHSFSKVIQREDKLKMTNIIINCFANLKLHEENIPNMAKVWLFLASELISDINVDKIEEFPMLNEFFLWPALNMHRMEEGSKKLTTVHWMKIYRKLSQDSETKKLEVLKDLEKIFKNNPLLSSNVISLLNIMSQFETKFKQEFVNKLMIVSSMILVLPNLKSEDEQKISTLVMQYFEPSLECYKLENDVVIKNVCASIEHILKIHGGFRILEPLTNFLKQSPKDVRLKYSNHLKNLALDLYNKESDSKSFNAKELTRILSVFNEKEDGGEKKAFVLPTGRSARIANLAKDSPKSPRTHTRAGGTPTTLRLFGKDLDTMSPLKVKGSQLNNTPPPSRKKKIVNSVPVKSNTTPSINDESSSEFVQINTEIKFQPDKLSDHQREVMSKRREDIPALYQDLSQSISQDMFSSKSNSKEAPAGSPKVVVEFIEKIPVLNEQRDWNLPIEENNKIVEINKPQKASTNNTQNSESDLFSNVSNNLITNIIKSSDNITDSSNGVLKEEITTEPIDSNVKNIEDRISSDLFTNDSSPPAIVKKVMEVTGNTNKKSEESSEEKKRRKMEAELLKLKMDIVGADEFVGTARRTRHKEKNKADENSENKVIGQPEKSRKSLSLERNESKVAPRGRKSIASQIHTSPEGSATDNQKEQMVNEKLPNKVTRKPETRIRSFSLELSESKVAPRGRKSMGAVIVKSDSSIASQIDISPEGNAIDNQKEQVANEEVQDSLEQLKNVSQIENISTLNENNKKETPLANRKSRKMKQVDQKITIDNKMSTKPPKLGDENNSIIEVAQENTTQVETRRNTRRKSLKIDIKNNTSTRQRVARKNKDYENNDDITEPPVSIDEITENTEVIQETNGEWTKMEESSQCTPKRGQKRKYSTDDDDDIIQSSQESAAVLTPFLNSSKKKLSKISLGKIFGDEEITVVQQKTLLVADFVSEDNDSNAEPVFDKQNTKVPVVVIEKTEYTDMMRTQTENEFEGCGEAVKNQNSYNDIEVQTEDTVTICNECGDITSLSQDIEGSIDETENIKGKRTVVEESVADNGTEAPLEANTTQDTTLTRETTQEFSVNQDSTQEDIPSEILDNKHQDTQDTQTQPQTITQETPTQKTTSSLEDTRPPILYFDLPKKPQLTESQQIMCQMDTMSVCEPKDSDFEGETVGGREQQEEVEQNMPFKKEAESIEDILATPSTGSPPLSTPPNSPPSRGSPSIPSSPITMETPTRTSELLDNTLDISPITSSTNSPVVDVSAEIPKAIAIFYREEEEEEVEEKQDERDAENDLEEGTSFSDECEDRQNVIEESEPSIFRNVTGKKSNSVAAPQIDANIFPERSFKPLNAMSVISPMPTKLFMKRRGGSGGGSPSTGRIRRLMSHFGPKAASSGAGGDGDDADEGDLLRFTRDLPSPLAVPRSGILKRKLSDDGDGLSPCAKRKRVNFCDPCLTSKKIFLKDDYLPPLEAKRLFDQDPLKELTFPEDATASSDAASESEMPETEPSLEIVNATALRRDRPIYPKLVDCKDDVVAILKRVTSPMFINAMTNKLRTKNIKTIGDLASQTESEINRIPFKVPVIANVFKALDGYYKSKNGITGAEADATPKVNGNKEVEKKPEPVEVQTADVATEMRSLVEKATSKETKTIDDLARTLLSSMDKQKIIDLIKKLDSPVTFEDFLDDNNQDQILRHVLDRKDPAEVLKSVHQNLNDVQRENLPWETLLRNRPVTDLQRGITGAIKQGSFSRTEVVENCLLPLIESPADIATYLRSLSVKDFEDIVAGRLEDENVAEFLCGMMKNHPTLTTEKFMEMFCKKQVFSAENLPASFKVCLEMQEEGSQKEIMVEMFRFISEKLDSSTLGSLHWEFLNRLINKDK